MAERIITPLVVGPVGSTGILKTLASSVWQVLSSADNAHIDLDDTSTAIRGDDVLLLVLHSSGTTGAGIKVKTSTNSPFTASGQPDQTFDITADRSINTIGATATAVKIGTLSVIGPFESARFKDTDGYLNFSRDTGDTAAADYNVQAIVIKRK